MSTYLGIGFSIVVLLLLSFAGLQWLDIPTGSFLDWVIGVAIFGWLLIIVTVPWNIYFEAKAALAEAEYSIEQGITVDPTKVDYIRVLGTRSLWIVLLLHGISAIALYGLAIANITSIGYIGSGAALLLTGLRPAIATYRYFATRIAILRQQFKYPRQDVLELRDRVLTLEGSTEQLQFELNVENVNSLIASQQREMNALRQDLTRVAAMQEDLRSTNQAEHERLSREARNAIAQLSTDGQFLENVREIIRFFKSA
ncbi:hypothetical protein ACQ4M3_03450 [Leptolyngbya sp. AN03gr2]|uniref:hypothetical protein n=1 Tax=unclassified Leptolyngbya TaxID=2650499 RepID=UPI003D31478C